MSDWGTFFAVLVPLSGLVAGVYRVLDRRQARIDLRSEKRDEELDRRAEERHKELLGQIRSLGSVPSPSRTDPES